MEAGQLGSPKGDAQLVAGEQDGWAPGRQLSPRHSMEGREKRVQAQGTQVRRGNCGVQSIVSPRRAQPTPPETTTCQTHPPLSLTPFSSCPNPKTTGIKEGSQ